MLTEEMDEFERLWRDGVPMSEMSRRLGYSDNYLNTIATRFRDRFPYRHLPTGNRREIGIAMLADGMPVADVAKTLAVSVSTVHRWRRML